MDFKIYKSFDIEDFLVDENFIKLVQGQPMDGVTIADLIKQVPEKGKEIAIANAILQRLSTRKGELSENRKYEILGSILNKGKVKVKINWLKYAAILLLFISIGAIVDFYINPKTDISNFVSTLDSIPQNIELVLGGGKRIEIESKESTIEYAPNGSTVSLNDSSTIIQPKASDKFKYNQIIVPYGKRSSLRLADGSLVMLNSGSRLIYPPTFTGNIREVYLEGEAYFEVSKDKDKPFYVRTDNFQVKVLGTRFLVQSVESEKAYNAILVEGKVSLKESNKRFAKEYELSPNQKASLSLNRDTGFQISEINDVENDLAWINGYLIFENEDIISVTKRVSRYYNIKIEVRTNTVTNHFSGKLDLKEDLEHLFSSLSRIYRFKYKKEEGKYIIYE